MKLEDIGFYTLSDRRAAVSSAETPLERCELILTDRCNFKCKYCRGVKKRYSRNMNSYVNAETVIRWGNEKLRHIRFSGGEPTLDPNLFNLVRLAKDAGVERCAISTNGSASTETYQKLIDLGVDDFSISLDGGCCSTGDVMSGVNGSWDKVVENIQYISKRAYCTVGIVFTEDNVRQAAEIVGYAAGLGVSDIRIIPSAQFNAALTELADQLPYSIVSKYPILKYRIDNMRAGRHFRGISPGNTNKCWLAVDDMLVAGGYHFPCVIHFREGGDPIGQIGPTMRHDRERWISKHSPKDDPICAKNCLDVCVDYNQKHHRNR